MERKKAQTKLSTTFNFSSSGIAQVFLFKSPTDSDPQILMSVSGRILGDGLEHFVSS